MHTDTYPPNKIFWATQETNTKIQQRFAPWHSDWIQNALRFCCSYIFTRSSGDQTYKNWYSLCQISTHSNCFSISQPVEIKCLPRHASRLPWFKQRLIEDGHHLSLTKNVFMAQQHCLVELGLSEPAGLLCGEENLDRHVLPSPFPFPYLTIASFANAANKVNLLGDCSLNLEKTSKIW